MYKFYFLQYITMGQIAIFFIFLVILVISLKIFKIFKSVKSAKITDTYDKVTYDDVIKAQLDAQTAAKKAQDMYMKLTE